ncbi:hypothetical protein MMC07_003481 [Pseudocyphellaria aurata]|nr:hypothetical protein [Pseudocyphellaria aurata]
MASLTLASLTMASLTTALKYFLSVFSTILETIEDLYLFVESHFDTQRDFEKMDDFLDFLFKYGFKLLCSAVFAALLSLCTWYKMPLKRSSRRDLEADISKADQMIQQLVDKNSELQVVLDETVKDRNEYRNGYATLATKNIVLGNRIISLSDLQPRCDELESELERSEARCLGLEDSLALLQRVRQYENEDRKLDRQRMKLNLDEDLAAVKKERDRAIAARKKEFNMKNDEVTLLKTKLEQQKAKFEVQLAEQSRQIHAAKLDLKNERLNYEELEKEFRELNGLEPEEEGNDVEPEEEENDIEPEEEANDAEPSKAKDEDGDDETTELEISLDTTAEASVDEASVDTDTNDRLRTSTIPQEELTGHPACSSPVVTESNRLSNMVDDDSSEIAQKELTGDPACSSPVTWPMWVSNIWSAK